MSTKRQKLSIGILGFGNMGQAIFKLLKKNRNHKFNICSIDINKVPGAKIFSSLEELIEKSDYVFLCIKPQEFHQLAPLKISSEAIFISIMAGVKIKNIKEKLETTKIIRSMPNLNLQVGKSVIGWHANKDNLSDTELNTITKIFSLLGKSFYLKNEDMLNAITAVSGSGPAYVFLFMEALIQSAQNLGFDKKTAQEIVTETLSGSLNYIKSLPNPDMSELINKVKSKKGTTEAALEELNINKFYSSWQRAIRKAYRRAQELSSYEPKTIKK